MTRRAWWTRKRWWGALALWVMVAYPLSVGPLKYVNHRGWLVGRYWHFFYAPLGPVFDGGLGEASGFYHCVRWWADLGDRHAASD